MSYREKQAWGDLVTVAFAVLAFMTLFRFLGVQIGSCAFGMLIPMGFRPILGFVKRTKTSSIFDERDLVIQERATAIGYFVFWLTFVCGSMGAWTFYQHQQWMPTDIILLFPLMGWVVFTIIQSVAILVQYKQGKEDALI